MSLPVLVNHFRLPICYYFCYFLYINNQIQWHKHLPFIFVFVYSVSASLSLSLFFLCTLLTKNTTQMKRSPAPSCSSSSSSSCVGSVIPHQSEKPKAKAKRAKKNHNPEKCQNGNSSAGSARRSSIYRGVTRWSISHFSLFNLFFSLMGFHLHVSYSSFCIKNTGTDGLGDMKLTFGTRVPGITFRTRKDDKVILLFFFFFMKNYNCYMNNERTKEICSLFF